MDRVKLRQPANRNC